MFVTWHSHAAGLLSVNAREGATSLLTWGASDVAGRREVGTTTGGGGAVVVVEKKAVMCHGWDAFPDLGEARPRDHRGGI